MTEAAMSMADYLVQVRTNARGVFHLFLAPFGSHVVTVLAKGYNPDARIVLAPETHFDKARVTTTRSPVTGATNKRPPK